MPAFGVTVRRLRAAARHRLRAGGHDLRLGAQRVEAGRELRAATATPRVIHGKHYHEETKATASQVMKYPGGHYLVVLNMAEARLVCDFIEQGGRRRRALARRSRTRRRPDSISTRDLRAGRHRQPDHDAVGRVAGHRGGVPPQHGAALRHAGRSREHFRTFDTICSATQERQDAVVALLREPLDLMVVVGGYNSSNTTPPRGARAVTGRADLPHRGRRLRGSRRGHASATSRRAARTKSRPPTGSARRSGIGITAGASTPNNKVGETIARICAMAGVAEELRAQTG